MLAMEEPTSKHWCYSSFMLARAQVPQGTSFVAGLWTTRALVEVVKSEYLSFTFSETHQRFTVQDFPCHCSFHLNSTEDFIAHEG